MFGKVKLKILALLVGFVVAAPALGMGLADLRGNLPFSFVYDGKPSSQLLSKWNLRHTGDTTTYTDPATGLEVRCDVVTFGDSAIDWVIHLKNTGRADTPIIEKILPLDLSIPIDPDDEPILHYSKGSTVGPTNDDYIPREKHFKPGDDLLLPGPPEKKSSRKRISPTSTCSSATAASSAPSVGPDNGRCTSRALRQIACGLPPDKS